LRLKKTDESFGFLGGTPTFNSPIGTSGLAQPKFDQFLQYSRQFFEAKQYSNNGPLVKKLEHRLASFHEARYCLTFCSGFWALALALETMKLSNRSEVIMPSLTYRRLADIAAWVKLKPRFCEVSEINLAITPETVTEVITEQTALILAVHPIINCCDIAGLRQLSEEKGIPLLVDSVESVFETSEQGRVGSMATLEVFSLHASKLINGGEGGYITTSDEELYEKLKLKRAFGFQGADNIKIAGGTNAKLCEIHAAMALANLDSLDNFIEHNLRIYRIYQEGISKIVGLKLREFDEKHKTSYKNIVLELTKDWPFSRDLTIKLLNAENVLARSYYSPALHQKNLTYQHYGTYLPLTDELSERFIIMPSGFKVTQNQIQAVIKLLQKFYVCANQIINHINETSR
jgi:dTDP-4-amino-4,6-dideoxygalactose transaminase